MNKRALFTVSAISLVTTSLGIIFAGLWVYYRSRGGYRAVRLSH
jgi:hypothetical protein